MEKNQHEFVLFGASGDLAKEKLYPALFAVFDAGQKANYIGFARTEMTTNQFRDFVRNAVKAKNKELNAEKLEEFVASWNYVFGSYDANGIAAIPKCGKNFFRYYYLAIPTSAELVKNICEALAVDNCISPDSTIVLEKPFGFDFASANELNKILSKHFSEKQIYRIDHYLARDLVQDLLALRFANPIFEQIWNGKYIEEIRIEIKEEEGIKNRGQYYEKAGAIRDMLQNHALQLLSFAVMAQPKDLSSQAIHKEKIKVINNLKLFNYGSVEPIEIGQYEDYRSEQYVAKDSLVETMAQLVVEVDSPKWRRVPIKIMSGKKLDKKTTDIIVEFKKHGHSLWDAEECEILNNRIRINVQPYNDISLRLNSDFDPRQKCAFPTELRFGFQDNSFMLQEPYENALRDLFNHDQSIFIGSKEILASWKFIDGVISKIDAKRKKILKQY
jgi:glucose-6-phosphate 1-dehydrogenase